MSTWKNQTNEELFDLVHFSNPKHDQYRHQRLKELKYKKKQIHVARSDNLLNTRPVSSTFPAIEVPEILDSRMEETSEAADVSKRGMDAEKRRIHVVSRLTVTKNKATNLASR
jgi:hypothetical protein